MQSGSQAQRPGPRAIKDLPQRVRVKAEINYNILPKTKDFKSMVMSNRMQKGQFLTNYYNFKISDKKAVCIYHVETQPPIPADSSEVWFRVLRSIRRQLEREIKLITFRCNTIWAQLQIKNGLKEIQTSIFVRDINYKEPTQPEQQPIQPRERGVPPRGFIAVSFGVKLVLTNKIAVDKLDKDDRVAHHLYQQMVNNAIKEKLRDVKMIEMGKGRFYRPDSQAHVTIQELGLTILKGYKFTLTILPTQAFIQIDACSRILRSQNFLEVLSNQQLGPADANNKFRGATVLAKYGNYRTYVIEEVDYTKSPSSKFQVYREGQKQEVSFMEYYQRAYSITVKAGNQPLLRAKGKEEKKMGKGSRFSQATSYVYLIPELVSLTGMSDEQRGNNTVMREVANYTKMSPIERCGQVDDLLKNFKGDSTITIGNQQIMTGYKLPLPIIQFGNCQRPADENGSFSFKAPIKQAATLLKGKWLFVHSPHTSEQAEICFNLLADAAKTYGIEVQEPIVAQVKYNVEMSMGDRIDCWKACIVQNMKKAQLRQPQVIVLLLSYKEVKFYDQIKRFCTNNLLVLTQFFKSTTLNSKKGMSVASKIMLQICAKCGYILWEVPRANSYWQNKSVATASISYSKGLRKFTMAMVGTTNNQGTAVHSYCMGNLNNKDLVPAQIYRTFFSGWLQAYYSKGNKKLPSCLIIYREGLSDAQIEGSINQELEQLYHVILTEIRKKVSQYANYSPQVIYLTVNKKVNSRYYDFGKNGNQKTVNNPSSGSVIFMQMSQNNSIDFYLTPQMVHEGTSTPVQYRLVYYNTENRNIHSKQIQELPLQAIAQLTYEQCFTYYNWQGAVRVPGVLQCADKLSKIIGEHIRENVNIIQFEKRLKNLQNEQEKKLFKQMSKLIINSFYFL